MSISITFNDTHKAIQNLEAKGASRDLAEEIVATVQAAKVSSDPATQADLARAEGSLRSEIKGTENNLIRWVIGAQIAGSGLLLATKLFT